ncbi:Hypothetical protein PHPALM_5488 [Phytophthora palmivora]|uniref:Reverse transcriptase/retrotransposon-derived protein RNase H-like domain-containing protein n=1 Tax=Phytophthora palmivora TaxID=4796 RepID=A0A2P4YH97_9STRA|nr:Hypothetical protein PHPALM_5488 [Phytophthora palmivora]
MRFCNEIFGDCLATLDRQLQRLTVVSFTKTRFVQSKVDFLSHEVSSEVIQLHHKKTKAVTKDPLPNVEERDAVVPCRFIKDFAVYSVALYQLKDAVFASRGDLTVAKRCFAVLQLKVMDAPILRHFDRDKEVHVMNEWALSSTLRQEHDGKLLPFGFANDAEMNYHPAEKEILALLLLLKVCYTQLAGRTIHVYTRVHKSKTLFGRTTQFAVMLSSWHLVVQWAKERDCSFAQLLQAGLTSFVNLE